MRFEEILTPKQILCFDENTEYNDLLHKCVRKLKSLYDISYSENDCIKAILERDKLGHTAFTEGLAIPHARFENIDGVHFIIAKVKEPIQVPQPEGDKLVNVFVLFLVSQLSPNLYLKILSSTMKFFNIDKGKNLEAIKNASNKEDIYKVFTSSEIEIKHKLKVVDIMNHRPVVVFPTDTVKEVLNRLYRHQENTAYVVDKEDNLVGYVSIPHILKSVIPDYIDMLGDISFVKEFEPFVKLLREETKLTVKEVMGEIEHKLDIGSTILEAAYYLTKHPKVSIPVVEKGKLKGTITPKTFLNKILRS